MMHTITLGIFFTIFGAAFFAGMIVGCIAGFILSELIENAAKQTETDYNFPAFKRCGRCERVRTSNGICECSNGEGKETNARGV